MVKAYIKVQSLEKLKNGVNMSFPNARFFIFDPTADFFFVKKDLTDI